MSQPSPPASTKPLAPPWQRETLWQRTKRRMLQGRQGFMLVLMAATAAWLWSYVQEHSHFPAHAVSHTYVVNAPEVGTLSTLFVEKGALVKKGQIIGQMDDSAHRVEHKIAQLEKKRLERLLVSTALQLRMSQVTLQTRLQSFVHEAQATLAAGRTRWRTTKAELSALNKELRWLNIVRKRQLGRPNNLGALQARQKSLQALLSAMPRLMRMYRVKRAKARRLAKRARSLSGKQAKKQMEKMLRPLQTQWAIQTLRIKKLSLLRRRLTLRAPVTGTIQTILQRPGARLLQGTPVLQITRQNQGRLIAYVDQATARRITPGMTVQVSLRFPKQHSLQDKLKAPKTHCAKVRQVGTIEPIPVRFRQMPNKPSWVRPVTIQLHQRHNLIPGELLVVNFTPGQCSTRTQAPKVK